ncbi:hypothetical protein GCM10009835_52720 [Planosporangium flavigriseum]|uniref:Uncharacterized protein n=1 Tax=Planosporangium flavigriseum TaxID=373681 RepID=A0A8J3LQQ5_9ACTN|nr:hypothetical protein Pfl04_42130 [Planosporangium flavigriseum]
MLGNIVHGVTSPDRIGQCGVQHHVDVADGLRFEAGGLGCRYLSGPEPPQFGTCGMDRRPDRLCDLSGGGFLACLLLGLRICMTDLSRDLGNTSG